MSLDTLRADRLNCYGYSRFKSSPALDRLAADSVVFENHLSAAPWTIPAHVSLLTSLWPGSHGVTGSLKQLRESEADYPTLAEARTTLAETLVARGYQTAAWTGGETLAPHFGYNQGFQRYETSMFKLSAEKVREMLAWVEANRARPLFLFWHTFEVHTPYLGTSLLHEVLDPAAADPVREAVDRYAEKMRMGQAHLARFQPLLEKRRAFHPTVTEALYVGAIRDADGWVGRLMDELKRLRIYDEALVIVTSDHGEEFGDHSPSSFYDAHGHTLWRELVHVPLLVKLPRQAKAGLRVTALTRTVDVMPTVLDVLGVPGPPQMQGESLRPLWEGGDDEPRPGFLESLEEDFEEKAIETERYKYLIRISAASVREKGRGFLPATPEWRGLYDLKGDPKETRNLLEKPVRPEHERLAEELDTVLRRHLASQKSDSKPVKLSPELIERLRSLGYVN